MSRSEPVRRIRQGGGFMPANWSAVPRALVFAVASLPAAVGASSSLRPGTVAGWNAYVAAIERRIAGEAAAPAPLARQALSGTIVTEQISPADNIGVEP